MSATQASCPNQLSLRSLENVDPYPVYRAASDTAPVMWDESLRGWVVLRYVDSDAVLKADETFAMPWSVLEGGPEALGRYGIFNLQGAEHTKAHKDLLAFFNPRKNRHLQGTVSRLVDESFERIRGAGEVDFNNEIARRVPGLMGLAFLGVPEDGEVLETVHNANVRLQNYMQGFGDNPAALAELQESHRELAELWAPIVEARRREPAEDIISRLVQQEATLPDWSETELMSQCLFLFGASFGNTANAITNAAYILASNEHLLRELRVHPEKIPALADEVIRVWGAVQFRIRIATRDTEIDGHPIKQGDRVIVSVASANRDARQFDEPDLLDVDRPGASRRHLTFGIGARYCVGAQLARLEIEQVVRKLVAEEGRLQLFTAAEPESEPRFSGLNYRAWEPVRLRLSSEGIEPVVAS